VATNTMAVMTRLMTRFFNISNALLFRQNGLNEGGPLDEGSLD
jgi:hypothetical protein